jgi:hypothetical protein
MSMNSIQPIYFTVTLTNFGASSEGFVDNTKAEIYIGDGATAQTTLAQSDTKARANIRWEMISMIISENANPIFFGNVEKTGAPSPIVAPATISFTVGFDREETVYARDPGTQALIYGVAALKSQIARVLSSTYDMERFVLNPEFAHAGTTIRMVTASPLDTYTNIIAGTDVSVVQLVEVNNYAY